MNRPEIESYVVASHYLGGMVGGIYLAPYDFYFVTSGRSRARSRRSTRELAAATKYSTITGAKNAVNAISRTLKSGYHYAILAVTKTGRTFEVWPNQANPVEQLAALGEEGRP